MSADAPEAPYTLGPARWRSLPRPQTKPSPPDPRPGRDPGGGYEWFRSWEFRPDTPREGKENVYAYHHRLLAVAWLFPDGWTAADILPVLAGFDVHHSAPEVDADWGVEWDNREACLELVDPETHGAVTRAAERHRREVAADD